MSPTHSSALRLDHPAQRWLDAFPLGNGRLGAMVFGGARDERIALNHENLWRGVAKSLEIRPSHHHLEEIRKAFFAGDVLRGAELTRTRIHAEGDRRKMEGVQPFQPFGDLRLHLDSAGVISGYRRELRLDDAMAATTFRCGAHQITARVFVSAADQVLVWELTSSEPVSGILSLDRIVDPDATVDRWSEVDSFGFDARFVEGISFSARAQASTDGVLAKSESGAVRFENSRRVLLRLALATDYHGEQPRDACASILARAPVDAQVLLANHLAEYRPLYQRCELHLPGGDDLPLDVRQHRLREGGADPALFALYFNYGRYLLLASSRNCDQPANLQGIWCEDLRPAWNCDYHADVNLQMNYWHAEATGLPECAGVLYDFLQRNIPGCQYAARNYLGCRGIFMQAGDIWKMNHLTDSGWDFWTGGAAWFAQHLWWGWLYSRDAAFLRDRAYPFIREVAAFYEDFLVDDGRGRLVTVPSQSPENRFVGGSEPVSLCIGATMDYLLIREALGNAIEASRILDVDDSSRIKWESILARIPDFQIGKHGQLLEWQEDYQEVEPGHRHISHLYGVHPGNMMTPTRLRKFYDAARVTLERRLAAGGAHTGWSRAWTCCFWARFGEGERAYEHLAHLLTDYNTESLLDTHPLPNGEVFQIDGNFGGTAAMAELLVQFHDGYVHLLPCLPAAWREGRVHGLRTWGGFEVGMEWSGGAMQRATVRAHASEDLRLRLPQGSWTARGEGTMAQIEGGRVVDLRIPRGSEIEVRPD